MTEDKGKGRPFDTGPLVHIPPRAIESMKQSLEGKTPEEIAERVIKAETGRDKYKRLAYFDELTSLFSRTGLVKGFGYSQDNLVSIFEFLSKEELEGTRYAEGYKGYSLVVIDLIGLHNINEKKGKSGGDKILKELANKLQAAAKREQFDFPARLQGDEFAFLAINVDVDELEEHVKYLNESLEGIRVNMVAATFKELSPEQALFFLEDEMRVAKAQGGLDEDGRSTGFRPLLLGDEIERKALDGKK